MAQVTISYSKDGLDVKLGDKTLANVEYVSIGRNYDGKPYCSISMKEKNKDDEYTTYTHIVASKEVDDKAEFPGFKVEARFAAEDNLTKGQQDIIKALALKKN